tara:strand:+ start:6928 stop:7050 length:123 start_codon:yes stop_codon:yes gene_type:complete
LHSVTAGWIFVPAAWFSVFDFGKTFCRLNAIRNFFSYYSE